ncbi:hypothetical protein RB195_002592 [Necator americanus]|uniref:Uncharacterized protein n=1 Tax=Necator americanus TaxID=51031 RepID=A0ABR1DJR0_NECAM
MMNDLTPELGRKRRAAWGAYKSIEDVVKKTRNTRLRAHLFNTTVLSALTYASETWAFRKKEENASTIEHMTVIALSECAVLFDAKLLRNPLGKEDTMTMTETVWATPRIDRDVVHDNSAFDRSSQRWNLLRNRTRAALSSDVQIQRMTSFITNEFEMIQMDYEMGAEGERKKNSKIFDAQLFHCSRLGKNLEK